MLFEHSVEDAHFLKIVNENIQLPLSFKMINPLIPDNRIAVKRRMENTLSRLKWDHPHYWKHCHL